MGAARARERVRKSEWTSRGESEEGRLEVSARPPLASREKGTLRSRFLPTSLRDDDDVSPTPLHPTMLPALPAIDFLIRARATAEREPAKLAVLDGRTGQSKTYGDLLRDVARFREVLAPDGRCVRRLLKARLFDS